ncbi:MAG TPA: hypothetical protein VFC38_07020 [Stellaceae bacterium]|nr:hypothetical protein [Stellaceae bacterium]
MRPLDTVIDSFVKEAQRDYVSLPLLVYAAKVDLGAHTPDELRKATLGLVGRLYDKGLRPGDYDDEPFKPWLDEGRQAALARIEREWIAFGKVPNLGHSICWFELKRD